jgi:hypothetical protein
MAKEWEKNNVFGGDTMWIQLASWFPVKGNFWMCDSQMAHHTLDGWKKGQCSGIF